MPDKYDEAAESWYARQQRTLLRGETTMGDLLAAYFRSRCEPPPISDADLSLSPEASRRLFSKPLATEPPVPATLREQAEAAAANIDDWYYGTIAKRGVLGRHRPTRIKHLADSILRYIHPASATEAPRSVGFEFNEASLCKLEDMPPEEAELSRKLGRIAATEALLADDMFADGVARDCHDRHHDDRSCSTCAARRDGIEEYRNAIARVTEAPEAEAEATETRKEVGDEQ